MARNNERIQVEISDKEIRAKSNFLKKGSRNMLQEFAPSSIVYTSEHELKVENNYVRSFVINGYPSRVSFGWLDNLYSYDGDMDTITYIVPANERTVLDELTAKITQYESQYSIELEKGNTKNLSVLEAKIKDLYQQRIKLEQNFENMFHVSTFCSMYNHDLKTLNKEAQKFQSRVAGSNIGIMPLDLRQDEGFKTVSPFGVNKIPDYYRNMNTGALSTMFPFYNSNISNLNGTFIGVSRINTPIFVDLFDFRTLGNANLFISGASGSGKTYLTSLITFRSAIEGVRTVIIDPENEYGPVTEALNGVTIAISPNSEMCINPFDIDEEIELDHNGRPTGRKFVDIKGKVSELLNLLEVMVPNTITAGLRADISETLLRLYADFGFTSDVESLYEEKKHFSEESGELFQMKVLKTMPRMSDFKNALLRQTHNLELLNFAKALNTFTEGGIYDLFDCYTNVDNLNFNTVPVVRFNVQGIEDEILRPIGMWVVTSWVMNKFIKKDLSTKKRLISDESWMMLEENMAGRSFTALFLENCARRIRKYNGSLCCASQNFREFVRCNEGQAILSNSSVRIFLQQTPEDIQAVGDKFILSDGEKEFLLSARRGEILMKVGNESVIAKVFAFPFEDELISRDYLEEDEFEDKMI